MQRLATTFFPIIEFKYSHVVTISGAKSVDYLFEKKPDTFYSNIINRFLLNKEENIIHRLMIATLNLNRTAIPLLPQTFLVFLKAQSFEKSLPQDRMKSVRSGEDPR